MQINGKRVLITGESLVMDVSLAKLFISGGAQVIFCSKRLQQIVRLLPSITIKVCDISCDEEVQRLFEFSEAIGGIDILVNNIDILHQKDFVKETTADRIREIDFNLGGMVKVVNQFLPSLMKRKEGALINISTISCVSSSEHTCTNADILMALDGWTQYVRWQVKNEPVKFFQFNLTQVPLQSDSTSSNDLDELALILKQCLQENQLEITIGQFRKSSNSKIARRSTADQ